LFYYENNPSHNVNKVKNWDVGMEWIDLLQDMDKLQAAVNAGNFSTS